MKPMSFVFRPRPHVRSLVGLCLASTLAAGCIEVQQRALESDTTVGTDTGATDVSDDDTKPLDDTTTISDTVSTDVPAPDTVSADATPTDTISTDVTLPPVGSWDVSIIEPGFLTFFDGAAPGQTVVVLVQAPNATGGKEPVAGATIQLSWVDDALPRPGGAWNAGPTCVTDPYGVCGLDMTASLSGDRRWRVRVHPAGASPDEQPHTDVLAEALTIVDLATGPRHSCALMNDGRMWCWGWNGPTGEPGDEVEGPYPRPMTAHVGPGIRVWPTPVPTPGEVSRIAMSGSFAGYSNEPGRATTCVATTGDDSAGTWCVGSGAHGLLGNGFDSLDSTSDWSRVLRADAEMYVDLEPAVYLAGHDGFMCAVVRDPDGQVDDDEAFCWGSNDSRQLGQVVDEDIDHSPRGEVIGISWINDEGTGTPALSVGRAHACVLRFEGDAAAQGGVSPRAYCWGSNSHGQLGFSPTRQAVQPIPTQYPSAWTLPCRTGGFFTGVVSDVTSKLRVQQVVAGGNHTCAIVRLQGLSSVTAGTLATSCLVDDTSSLVWCSGANDAGQGGPTGNVEGRWLLESDGRPAAGFTELVAGAAFTCGVRNGGVYCWGSNGSGQIGDDPNQTFRTVPTRIELPDSGFNGGAWTVRRLVAGPAHACAIVGPSLAAGPLDQLHCWGDNTFSQAGSGVITTSPHLLRRIQFQ